MKEATDSSGAFSLSIAVTESSSGLAYLSPQQHAAVNPHTDPFKNRGFQAPIPRLIHSGDIFESLVLSRKN